MKKIILSSLILTNILFAQISQEEKDMVQGMIKGTVIEDIKRSSIGGMYEVYMKNGSLLYILPFEEKIIMGDVFTKKGQNITQQKRSEWQSKLAQSTLSNITFEDILKVSTTVDYNGGNDNYSIAMITDPECPFCVKAEKYLIGQKTSINYIYNVAMPQHTTAPMLINLILNSKNKSNTIQILLSDDAEKIIVNRNFSIEDKKEKLKKLGIQSSDDKSNELFQKMSSFAKDNSINGTPNFIVFDKKNGSMVEFIKGANIEKLKKYTN